MSQYRFERNGKLVITGADTRLGYVFMSIHGDGFDEVLFSNMWIPDPFEIQDINYFVKIAKEEFDIDFPEGIIRVINSDMLRSDETVYICACCGEGATYAKGGACETCIENNDWLDEIHGFQVNGIKEANIARNQEAYDAVKNGDGTVRITALGDGFDDWFEFTADQTNNLTWDKPGIYLVIDENIEAKKAAALKS